MSCKDFVLNFSWDFRWEKVLWILNLFFIKYGIANYPVEFTLEESIARDIQGKNSNYLITCDDRKEVEQLLIKILTA